MKLIFELRFTTELIFDSIEEKELALEYLTTSTSENRRWDFKQKKYVYGSPVITKHTYFSFNKKLNKYTTTHTSAKNLKLYLESLGYDIDSDYKENTPIVLLDKWVEIFKNHPDTSKGKIQLESAVETLKYNNGIISLATGGGKSEILLSYAESYLEQHTKNILIITYSNKVLDELKLRAFKYGLDIGTRIKFINPTGYYKSLYSNTNESKEWLENVGLLIADEAHHFSTITGTWARIVYDSNPDFIYGFTASSDISGGISIDYITPTLNPPPQVMSLMSFCGEMRVNEELKVPIKITTVKSNITSCIEYEKFKEDNPKELQFLPSLFLNNKETPKLLKHILSNYIPNESMCFIPIITCIADGEYIALELNKLGIDTVFYSGSSIITPIGKIPKLELEDLKELARSKAFRVLISNSIGIEGLDIPGLSSIISLTGTSYKSIIQSLGRSARADLVHCVFIMDRYNRVLNKQMKTKYDIVKTRLNVISDIKVNY